ncbi:MAG: hypothetical protein PGN34_25825 [Methylobacterium frigidaeris]
MRYALVSKTCLGAAGSLGLVVLALSGASHAQSVGSRIDQPTPATLPSGTHQGNNPVSPADQPTGRVAPPSAISSSSDVMRSEGSVQGEESKGKINPIQHLPKDMRR